MVWKKYKENKDKNEEAVIQVQTRGNKLGNGRTFRVKQEGVIKKR
jgi:hypothetical protein